MDPRIEAELKLVALREAERLARETFEEAKCPASRFVALQIIASCRDEAMVMEHQLASDRLELEGAEVDYARRHLASLLTDLNEICDE